jgi:hypothetical protein
VIRVGGVQRLSIGVGDDEVDALNIALDHVGDGVAARTADADHADPGPKFVTSGRMKSMLIAYAPLLQTPQNWPIRILFARPIRPLQQKVNGFGNFS